MKDLSNVLQQHKARLRTYMQTLCQQHANTQAKQQGLAVTKHLIAFLCACRKDNQHDCRVALFVSLRDEIDLSALHQWLQQQNMQRLIPHVSGQDLLFFSAQPPAHPPPEHITCLRDVSHCCALLVPGMAFDHQGHRLGRGKGFYDRFLDRLRKKLNCPTVIGVCMQHQLVEHVPIQPHDQPVDAVCTPELGILYS